MTEPTSLVKVPEVTQDEINEWYLLDQELAKIKARELFLRTKIFAARFAAPVEGTNKLKLDHGWAMKGVYVINRKVDLASLKNLADELAAAKVPTDAVFKYTPELVKSAYNLLNDEQKKVVDRALIIKPGTPQLEIVLPKRG